MLEGVQRTAAHTLADVTPHITEHLIHIARPVAIVAGGAALLLVDRGFQPELGDSRGADPFDAVLAEGDS